MKLKKEVKRIFFRNTVIVFLPVLFSFFLFFTVTYYSQKNAVIKNAETRCNFNTAQTLDRYNAVMSEINNQISEFFTSADFNYFFYEKNVYSGNAEDFRKTVTLFNKNTINYSVSYSFIRNIGMYCINNDFLIFGKEDTLYSDERENVLFYIDYVKNQNRNIHFFKKVYANGDEQLYILQKIFYNNDYVGIVIYCMDCDMFFKRVVSDFENFVCLSVNPGDKNEILYENNPKYEHRKLYVAEKTDGGNLISCTYDITDLVGMNNVFGMRLWLVIISCFLILIVITFFISVKLYIPFKTINKIIDDPSVYNDGIKNREYDFISQKIRSAVGTKFMLENQLAENLENLKKMESIALQTQINPHFLYNTLQVISSYSITLTEEENDITQMIENLSKMLKYAFSTKSFTVTVSEELKYLEMYCDFQRERFVDKFEVLFDIDENLLEKDVLKLMFQPIFENAINHGVRKCDRKCFILLKGTSDGRYMIFDIINNGLPIEKEEAEKINRYLAMGEMKEDKNIGLSNINKRIKIIFGEAYGVSLFKNDNNETVTRIKLPLY